ncbi:MAG: nitroreductase family deazaflavin-dependent oxidoreductase [Chloroflexi bacterium]|nr:nitroreductase family deazaflavin-dependent oxidoreductase [Chloroflexota bacterium]
MASGKFINERLTYPGGSLLKYLYKTPILLYRMGLGPLIGRLFMVMTTVGRKSGLPRRTAIEFHEYGGRKYAFVGWVESDWYKNIMANPLMTIQTAAGVEHVRARRVDSVEDRTAAWNVAEHSPGVQMAMKLSGMTLTREDFVAQKDRFVIITFDPTDEPTPPPLDADLKWLPQVVLNIAGTIIIQAVVRRWLRARKAAN